MGITEAVQGSQGSAQTGPGPSGGPTSQCSSHALKVAAIMCGWARGPKDKGNVSPLWRFFHPLGAQTFGEQPELFPALGFIKSCHHVKVWASIELPSLGEHRVILMMDPLRDWRKSWRNKNKHLTGINPWNCLTSSGNLTQSQASCHTDVLLKLNLSGKRFTLTH